VNALVADDLQHYEELGIPAGVYHFDRPWALGSEGFGELRFDPSRFPNAAPMLALLRARGWHTDVWFSEWLLDARLARAKRHGWLAPDSGREVDVTDRGAVRSVESDLRRFLRGPEGRYVDGLFVDRTDEIVPSAASSIYDDGRNGRQMHNAYPPEFQSILARVVRAERRARGWLIARAAYTGTPRWAMTWGGDTASRQQSAIVPEQPDTGPSTDLGLRSVLISLQRAAFMGIPYWGSDIGGYSSFIDRDLFARWIEVGAASPLMRFHGKGPRSPWAMPTDPADDPEMLTIYRRYITLHHRLAPTLHELAAQSHRTGAPIVRPLAYDHPEDPRAQNLIDEWKIGPDLLAAPVWQTGVRSRVVHLPAGTWVDFWDRTRTLTGPAEVDETVPLDRLPLYVRSGSPLLGMPAPP
jgi:alpha-glucosidase (family GH31 glycosyl hydrolase)